MIDNIFFDIGIIMVVGTAFAYLARLLKQPIITGYVLAGLILGPFLQIITNQSIIVTLSEMGIAFLLFIVGLEIDLRKLKEVGMVSTIGGLTKSLILFSLGYVVVIFAGFRDMSAIYLGLILAFSSTMVVIKVLSDKRELDTLHARIIIGFLIIEDILAIFAMIVLANLDGFSFTLLFEAIWKTAFLFVIARGANKYIFPGLFKFAAKSSELLFLTAVAVTFTFSLLFSELGFSISIGAFVAGISLANLPYVYEIVGKVKSMRDFFSTIFFVSLGMSIVSISKSHIIITVILLLIIWLLKPLIVMFITAFFGYNKRPAFLTAISLAQISEFSLIIVTQGLVLGHISQEVFSIAAIIAVVTMSSTSYFIKYEYSIYSFFKDFLRKFDGFTNGIKHLEYQDKKLAYDVLLVGYDRIGYSIVKKLHILKKHLIVVDYNPEIIKKLIGKNIHCLYGDISDEEILERIDLKGLSMAVSTSPDKRDNKLLIKKVKAVNKKAMLFVTASQVEDALELYDAGADYVIVPHLLGGDHVSLLIEQFGNDIDKLIAHKLGHIEELRDRQSLGHDRPTHQNERHIHH
ncbi:hypothetical protein GOV09_07305 [Candidatus Woesearchaeota archaeon]|nr:hypothetical protein [Candidatus Woesearchaeota archaeon]